jgi:hypothetical protein
MLNRASKILVALIAAASSAAAQQTAPDPGTAPTPVAPAPQAPVTQESDASGILLAPKSRDAMPMPPVDSDGETRTVSSKVAAALSMGMPKFSPPTPTPTPAAAEPEDLRDIDKPRNEIHRLPKYVVREARPPIFRERDLFTMDGMLDLTMKRHSGLIIGNILGLNSNPKPGSPAYQMMVDDERKENMDDLNDTAHAISQGDSAGASYILQQSQSTYMRGGGDWDWSATGPVGGILGGGGK